MREIFSNILAHRDYSSGFVAKFVIEKDKMFTENSNISNKIGILDIKNFKPVSKNPLISKIFREIGLADELGSGMRNTNKYTMMYSHTYPIFEEGDIFTTIIPLQEISTLKVGGVQVVEVENKKLSKEEILLLISDKIRENNKITLKELSDTIGVSSKTVSRYLREIGNIKYYGKGKNGYWHIDE